jgi:hypothetical protein
MVFANERLVVGFGARGMLGRVRDWQDLLAVVMVPESCHGIRPELVCVLFLAHPL